MSHTAVVLVVFVIDAGSPPRPPPRLKKSQPLHLEHGWPRPRRRKVPLLFCFVFVCFHLGDSFLTGQIPGICECWFLHFLRWPLPLLTRLINARYGRTLRFWEQLCQLYPPLNRNPQNPEGKYTGTVPGTWLAGAALFCFPVCLKI